MQYVTPGEPHHYFQPANLDRLKSRPPFCGAGRASVESGFSADHPPKTEGSGHMFALGSDQFIGVLAFIEFICGNRFNGAGR